MKINHGSQHPAKANGFAHLNRHDSKAKESGPGSSPADTSRFKAQEKGENNSKITTQFSKHHHSNIKDLDEKKNPMYSHGSKHISRLSAHNNSQIKFRDSGQKNDWQHPHGKKDVLRLSSHGHLNIKLYDSKKLVLREPIHIRHLNIKHLDKKKNLLHYPIISHIRINVKDFDHAKQQRLNHHNLISAHNRLNVKYKIVNLPGFKLDSLGHHSGKVSNGNRDYGTVYGLNSKEFASVLRLTELTMRIKAESGGRIDYDAEYQKALKSWVGHFGGVYAPPEKDSSSHKSAPHGKPAAHNHNHVKEQHTKNPHINNTHAKWLN